MSKAQKKPSGATSRHTQGPVASADEDIAIFVDSFAPIIKDLSVLLQFHLSRGLMKDGQAAARLAHVYSAVRRVNDSIAEAVKPLGEAQLKLSSIMVPEAFQQENVKTFTTGDGYRVTLSHRFYAAIKADSKNSAYDWLRTNNLGALIIETVNSSTLSSAGKALLEEGKELPEDFFNTHYQDQVSLTKVKKKARSCLRISSIRTTRIKCL